MWVLRWLVVLVFTSTCRSTSPAVAARSRGTQAAAHTRALHAFRLPGSARRAQASGRPTSMGKVLAEHALGLRRLCLRGGRQEGGAGGGDGEAHEACGGDAECEDSQPPADLLSVAQGLCQHAWEGKATLRELSLLFRQVELTAATREHSTTLEQQYILHIVDTIMQGVAAVAATPASLSTDHIAAARAVLDGGLGGEARDGEWGGVSEGGVIGPDVDGGGVVALVQDLLARAEAMADAATAMANTDYVVANERNAMGVGADAAKAMEDAANAVGVQKCVGEFAQGWPAQAANAVGVNANVANVANARGDAALGVKAVEGAAIDMGASAANSKRVTNVAANAMGVTTAAHAMEEEEGVSHRVSTEPVTYTATAPKAIQDPPNAMGAKAREDAAKAAYVSPPLHTPGSPRQGGGVGAGGGLCEGMGLEGGNEGAGGLRLGPSAYTAVMAAFVGAVKVKRKKWGGVWGGVGQSGVEDAEEEEEEAMMQFLDKALDLFRKMRQRGVVADMSTYSCLEALIFTLVLVHIRASNQPPSLPEPENGGLGDEDQAVGFSFNAAVQRRLIAAQECGLLDSVVAQVLLLALRCPGLMRFVRAAAARYVCVYTRARTQRELGGGGVERESERERARARERETRARARSLSLTHRPCANDRGQETHDNTHTHIHTHTHTHTHTGTVTVNVDTRRMATDRQRHPEKRARCLGREGWSVWGEGGLTRNCEGG